MAFKDILLQLSTYPDASKVGAVDWAVEIAEVLGSRISALAFDIELHAPGSVFGSFARGVIANERAKNTDSLSGLLSAFEEAATRRGVVHDHIVEKCVETDIPGVVTDHARLRDMTIIPVGHPADFQQTVAEGVIFGSGRPVLILPEVPMRSKTVSFDTVGIAWDFGRPAATAVANALPLLKRAKSVRVVMVKNDKPIQTRLSGADLARHLNHHGIEVVLDDEDAEGRSVGQTLDEYATEMNLDVLVMGAYGHSRFREFILGGATKRLLANPQLPVFMAH